jgi:diacylglycerol O-acyltransferase / wax synthase
MWRENCEIDLTYHVRPYRVDSPGGRRQLDEAVGRIAGTPLVRSKPLWEMYFIEGLANGRIAVLGKIHHALADGVASANLLARGMDLQTGPEADRDSYAMDPAPARSELLRSAFATARRSCLPS